MLDLKKLEEKLDKALAGETKESLTKWLNNKRMTPISLRPLQKTLRPLRKKQV